MSYLEVRGLEKSFVTARGTTRVLAGLDLTLEQGEFVAVVGYSGSGKTTLVSLIGGLLAPDRASIALDGALVTRAGARARHRLSAVLAPAVDDASSTTWRSPSTP